jgi:hypothetical protein
MSDLEALRGRVRELRVQLDLVRVDLVEARAALRAGERQERERQRDARAARFEAQARRRIVAPVERRRVVTHHVDSPRYVVNSVFALGAMTRPD